MSTFKKLLALTLALAMVLSVTAFAGYSKDTYKDAADIDADCESAIELMYALDIMTGDNLGNFNPKATITRGEMAKMIYVILNYGDDDLAVNYKGAKFFSDVNAGDWYEGYVNYMAMTKLVQGRPDGTFGPNDPVTTAEAAKMLLTALGYSAADRGYTGANWAQNVLSDAAILELLKGYNYSTTGYAPRQWVAVMVENALGCYTIDTMKPTFGGLLISGVAGSYETMGQKYYGYNEYEGYLYAANGYYVDGSAANYDWDSSDLYLYDTSDEKVYGLDGDVTIEDLGQHFKVIAIGDDVISIRNTGKSAVAEDEVKDVTWELTYDTDDNKYNNKYEFTVDELTGKADTADGKVNVLDVKAGNKKYEDLTSSQLQAAIKAAGVRNDVVRAIDRDGNGDIEYVIYTPVQYAQITKVATSQKYGDYIKAVDVEGNALTFNEGSNLYIEDVIITEDELEVDNFVKFTWNIDEGMYNVEVLPVAEAVEFDSRKINKNEYTFAGETYGLADNAFAGVAGELKKSGILGDDYDIVVDGDLIVYAVPTDGNYKSMDEVNANLAVLIKADNRNSGDDNSKQVKLLTIDGETAWYGYDNVTAIKKGGMTWAQLFDTDYDEKNSHWDKLYIKHETDDGLWLEAITLDADLNLETELVDMVEYAVETLDTDDDRFNGDRVDGDNQFFAYIDDEYKVITMDELEDGDYAGVKFTTLINNGTYYNTIVGGYAIIGDAVVAEDGYLFVTEIYEKETEDATTILALINGVEEEVEIELSKNSLVPALYNCYYYEYDGDVYTLKTGWDNSWTEMDYVDGELFFEVEGGYDTIDFSDYDVFALKTVEKLRNVADGNNDWEVQDTTVVFTTAEELLEAIAECEAMLDEDDETYSFDYFYIENCATIGGSNDDILYVQINLNMIENQYE